MTDHDGKLEAHRRILNRLRDQARDVKHLTGGLSADELARQVVEGKWSLKELAGHLWRVQQVFEERLDKMLGAENPKLESWNPENDPAFDRMLEKAPAQVVEGYLAARASFLDRLDKLTPAEWHRPAQHPDYPMYDVHFMIEYLTHHEAHHLYQMYHRRAQLGKIPH
jgi:uncharacterized damage-inducible protein DinB